MGDDRNIFIRLGMTKETWDKLQAFGPERSVAEIAEDALEHAVKLIELDDKLKERLS